MREEKKSKMMFNGEFLFCFLFRQDIFKMLIRKTVKRGILKNQEMREGIREKDLLEP